MTHTNVRSQAMMKGGVVMRRRIDVRAVASAMAIPFILAWYFYMSTFLTASLAGTILYTAIVASTGGMFTLTLGYLVNKLEGGER